MMQKSGTFAKIESISLTKGHSQKALARVELSKNGYGLVAGDSCVAALEMRAVFLARLGGKSGVM